MTTFNEIFYSKALEWIDTPYVHQSAQRFGCDCSGIVTGVLNELGYATDKIDCPDRPKNAIDDRLLWRVQATCEVSGHELAETEIGEILVFKVNEYIQHIAIKGTDDLILHADRFVGRVVLTGISESLKKRFGGAYLISPGKLREIAGE
jgi:NlpC/P60 family